MARNTLEFPMSPAFAHSAETVGRGLHEGPNTRQRLTSGGSAASHALARTWRDRERNYRRAGAAAADEWDAQSAPHPPPRPRAPLRRFIPEMTSSSVADALYMKSRR